jgi:hypothetical protein
MGAFNINITGVGGHGCERKAKPGDKLYGRCGRFTCPDCAAYDFAQRLRQAGMVREGDTAYQIELSEDDPRVVAFKGARLVEAADENYVRAWEAGKPGWHGWLERGVWREC